MPHSSPASVITEETRDDAAAAESGPWRTTVWNDPVNLMSYVVYVFQEHFGYSRAMAHQLMMRVHEDGHAVVSRGSRERMEGDVQAMHTYGLHATLDSSESGAA